MASFRDFIILFALVQVAAALPLNVVDPVTCEILDLRIADPQAALAQLAAGTLHPPSGLDLDEFTSLLQECDDNFRGAQKSRIAAHSSGSGRGASSGHGSGSGPSGGGPGSRFNSFSGPGHSNAASSNAASNSGSAPAQASQDTADGQSDAANSVDSNSNAASSNQANSSANRVVNPIPVNPDEPSNTSSTSQPDNQTDTSANAASANSSPASGSESPVFESTTPETSASASSAPASPPADTSNTAPSANSATSNPSSPFRSFGQSVAPHSSGPARERFGGSAAERTAASNRGNGNFGLDALGLNSVGGLTSSNLLGPMDGLAGGITGNIGSVKALTSPLSLLGGSLPIPGVPHLPTGIIPGVNSVKNFAPFTGATEGVEHSAEGGAEGVTDSATKCKRTGDVTVCSETKADDTEVPHV
ncbi:hypothetical protein BXZ70DRAFT_1010292 [Cristinia sonorae]|uniref:Uncharacterized protein n=1 Tax=Cristinia sonorae TaxID=1940300 RepID=A0A8K0UIU0_9AGAR|nr:hypothetical protein BXZ70DRAFT_1010292 [Cristinia sonorae]